MFGSSTGFRFPDNSVLSPGASLVRLDRWQALTPEQRRGFAPLCPDLVVELASPSDEAPRALMALRSKMAAYQAKGARRGVTANYEINLVTLISTMAGQQESPNPGTFLYSDTHAEEFIQYRPGIWMSVGSSFSVQLHRKPILAL